MTKTATIIRRFANESLAELFLASDRPSHPHTAWTVEQVKIAPSTLANRTSSRDSPAHPSLSFGTGTTLLARRPASKRPDPDWLTRALHTDVQALIASPSGAEGNLLRVDHEDRILLVFNEHRSVFFGFVLDPATVLEAALPLAEEASILHFSRGQEAAHEALMFSMSFNYQKYSYSLPHGNGWIRLGDIPISVAIDRLAALLNDLDDKGRSFALLENLQLPAVFKDGVMLSVSAPGIDENDDPRTTLALLDDGHAIEIGVTGSISLPAPDAASYHSTLPIFAQTFTLSSSVYGSALAYQTGERPFSHDFSLQACLEATTPRPLQQLKMDVEEVFHEKISPFLVDPYLLNEGDDLEDADEEWHSGSQEMLTRLLQMVIYCAPILAPSLRYAHHPDPRSESVLNINVPSTSCHDRLERLVTAVTDFGFDGPAIAPILSLVLQENDFSGHQWEYNDGAYNRQSGYSKYPTVACIEIELPSATERARARRDLKAWLHERLGPDQARTLLSRLSGQPTV